MNVITVKNLTRQFSRPKIVPKSLSQRIKNYLLPQYQTVNAVDDISFSIKKGERVAFIGPNGAGKSTTIKILTGILQPTDGQVEVLGYTPSADRKQLVEKIGAIFGHCSKLWYHLPVQESYTLLAAIYDLSATQYKERLAELVKKFDIKDLLSRPVRQLSLGERMRCEIVGSLLHKPTILFLDEPTIGLDIAAKKTIRDLLCKLSEQDGTSLILTSHDTDDIEMVCDRVVMINQGKIILNDSLSNIKTQYIKKKVISIVFEEQSVPWEYEGCTILKELPHELKIEVDLSRISVGKVTEALFKAYTIRDLTIEDPSLETIIRSLY